jgi:hypothetical protein
VAVERPLFALSGGFVGGLFLIGHINVNKGVLCLIISYLQIKSYNVLNYNNCSTDWPFPLMKIRGFEQSEWAYR